MLKHAEPVRKRTKPFSEGAAIGGMKRDSNSALREAQGSKISCFRT